MRACLDQHKKFKTMVRVNNLEDLLWGAKHLQFLLHCGSLDVISIPNKDSFPCDYSYQTHPEHKRLEFFSDDNTGQAAFIRAFSQVDLQQIETIKIWIGIVKPVDSTSVNDILGALSAAGATIKTLLIEGAWRQFDLSTADANVLNRLAASVKELTFINVSRDAAHSDNWGSVPVASLRTLKVTTALSRPGEENFARLVLERLRRFATVTTLQFHEQWKGVSFPFLPQPNLWIDELCSLVTTHLPLVTCLECADLNTDQVVKLLNMGRLEKLALKYHFYESLEWKFEDCIQSSLAEDTTLKSLSLHFSFCSTSVPQVGPILRGIAANQTLQELDLYTWRYEHGGLEVVKKAIAVNKSIERLTIRFDNERWAIEVASALSTNTHVKSLRLLQSTTVNSRNTTVVPVGKFHPTLENLEVRMVTSTPAICFGRQFEQELKQNSGIQSLKLFYLRRDTTHEYSSPEIEHQLLLTREVQSEDPLLNRLSPALWPRLLQLLDRKKSSEMVYKVLGQAPDALASTMEAVSRKRTARASDSTNLVASLSKKQCS